MQRKILVLVVTILTVSAIKTYDLGIDGFHHVPANTTSLTLSNLGLISLPLNVTKLVDLQSLRLNSNLLTGLPAEIGALTSLTLLDLSGNRIATLPTEISQLANLQTLYLIQESPWLLSLPSPFWSLTELNTLWIDGAQLTSIPATIGNLDKLTSLSLENLTNLTSIPNEIGQLSELTLLKISGIPLVDTIPTSLFFLHKLTDLTLNNMPLWTSISSALQMPDLVNLDLSHNRLDTFADEVWGQLSKLETLLLNDNLIADLDLSLSEASNLKHLYLDHNLFLDLPAVIPGQTSLQTLTLNNNPVNALPLQFASLTNLVSFSYGAHNLNANQTQTLIHNLKDVQHDYNIQDWTSCNADLTIFENRWDLTLVQSAASSVGACSHSNGNNNSDGPSFPWWTAFAAVLGVVFIIVVTVFCVRRHRLQKDSERRQFLLNSID